VIILLFLLPSTYLLDESFTWFPTNEETLFIGSRRAIRIVQGFSDIDGLKQRYEAKFEIPLFSELSFYYRFYKENSYDLQEELHRFELNWIPRENTLPPWVYSFVVAPAYQKRYSMIGLGFGYWRNLANNHSLYLIVEDFHHYNRYSRFPIRMELEGRIRNNWANLSYYYRFTLPGKKDFFLFDEVIGRGEQGGKALSISSHYRLMKNLSGGLRLSYLERDSSYVSFNTEEDFNWQWEHLFAEPFLEICLLGRDNLHIGFPMNYKRISRDTLDYERKGIGITLLYNYQFRDWLTLLVGIQKSWSRLIGEENSELRGGLSIEFRVKKKTYIAIREVIELEWPLSNMLQDPRSRAFLMFSHRF